MARGTTPQQELNTVTMPPCPEESNCSSKVKRILQALYHRVDSLEAWVRHADQTGLLHSSLLTDNDDKRYRHLLHTTLVAVKADDKELEAAISLAQAMHQHELVVRSVQRVLLKDGPGNNVLSFGFSTMTDNTKALMCGMPNLEYRYPNTSVSRLQYKVWRTLLTRIGDYLMSHLLENTSIFVQLVSTGVYLQITGEPVYHQWPYSAGQYWDVPQHSLRPQPSLNMKARRRNRHKTAANANKHVAHNMKTSRCIKTTASDASNYVFLNTKARRQNKTACDTRKHARTPSNEQIIVTANDTPELVNIKPEVQTMRKTRDTFQSIKTPSTLEVEKSVADVDKLVEMKTNIQQRLCGCESVVDVHELAKTETTKQQRLCDSEDPVHFRKTEKRKLEVNDCVGVRVKRVKLTAVCDADESVTTETRAQSTLQPCDTNEPMNVITQKQGRNLPCNVDESIPVLAETETCHGVEPVTVRTDTQTFVQLRPCDTNEPMNVINQTQTSNELVTNRTDTIKTCDTDKPINVLSHTQICDPNDPVTVRTKTHALLETCDSAKPVHVISHSQPSDVDVASTRLKTQKRQALGNDDKTLTTQTETITCDSSSPLAKTRKTYTDGQRETTMLSKRQRKRMRQNKHRQKQKVCTHGLSAYKYHQYFPRLGLLYGRDMTERFPKTSSIARLSRVQEGWDSLFNDIFRQNNVGGNLSEAGQQCQCQNQCDQSPPMSSASHAGLAPVIPLLKEFLSNHKSFKYGQYLKSCCPCSADAHWRGQHRKAGKKGAGFYKRGVNKPTSTGKLLEEHIPLHKVHHFLCAVVKQSVSVQLLGSTHNRAVFLTNVRSVVSGGKFERVCLGQVMEGMKVKECGWLSHVTCHTEKRHRLAQLVWWLVKHFVFPVIKTFFYVTDTTTYRTRVLYYRKSTWLTLHTQACQELRKSTNLQPVSKTQVLAWIASGQSLGVSVLRFLPKSKALRPIVNMSRKHRYHTEQKSINNQLKSLFDVLTHEKMLDGSLCGCSVFGLDDICLKLKQFKTHTQSVQGHSPLYFVKSDINKCFDSIQPQLLFSLITTILSKNTSQTYMTRKFASVHMSGQRLKRNFQSDTTRLEDFQPDFVSFSRQQSALNRWSNVILVDRVSCGEERTESLLTVLSGHLFKNIIMLGGGYYLQKTGISQGSVLSVLLASIYLSHLEHTHLPLAQDELLIRWMDDYLYITPREERAVAFVDTMIRGFPDLNCYSSVEKMLTSFRMDRTPHTTVSHTHSTGVFPWCGLLIDMTSLDVSVDYSRYSGLNIKDTATFDSSHKAGNTLKNKLLMCLWIKCHPIFFDPELNSRERILLNAYQALLFVAATFHSFVSKLHAPRRVNSNPRFFASVVKSVPLYLHNLVTKKLKKLKCEHQFPIPPHYLQWLTADAFLTKLHIYAGYRPLKKFLKAKKLAAQKKLTSEDVRVLRAIHLSGVTLDTHTLLL